MNHTTQTESSTSNSSSRGIVKAIGIVALGLILLVGSPAAVAFYEYRTNAIARWIGWLLANTNNQRRAVGSLWIQLQSRADVQKSLDLPVTVSESGDGLPDAVSTGRFEMRRIPEKGLPGYVGIWRTPLDNPEQRQLPDVIESLRIYRWCLDLLEGIELPDVRYRNQAKREVESLYRQLGEIDVSEIPIADSLQSPDSLGAVVSEEITKEMIDRLKQEEFLKLREDFEMGNIGQIYIYQGLARYRGEIVYHDSQNPKITFELKPDYLRTILELPTESQL